MRMFTGVASTLILASGVAVSAAVLTHGAQEPKVWVSKDGDRATVITEGPRVIVDDDDQPGDQVRRLAVLAGRGPQLGVSVRDLDAEQAKTQTGVVVDDVRTGSAAEKAGIRKGDVITEFDGERVRGVRHLTRLVTETPDGRTVKAAVQRDGRRVDLSVTPDSGTMALGKREFELLGPPMRFEGRPGEFGPDFKWDMGRIPGVPGGAWTFKGMEKGRLGVSIQTLDGQLAEYFGTSKGVLVNSVEAGSPAAKAGLKAGDVVTAVNGTPVADAEDLIEAVRAVEDGATLSIDYTRDKKALSTKATLEKKEPAELPRKRPSTRPI
jgi:membrane-associated protease RseP (regulator of RpoE activity)